MWCAWEQIGGEKDHKHAYASMNKGKGLATTCDPNRSPTHHCRKAINN